MEKRYTVQEVRGIGVGAGMFQVVDGHQGKPVGEPTFWKDEAEKKAKAMNCALVSADDDLSSMPYGTYGDGVS